MQTLIDAQFGTWEWGLGEDTEGTFTHVREGKVQVQYSLPTIPH